MQIFVTSLDSIKKDANCISTEIKQDFKRKFALDKIEGNITFTIQRDIHPSFHIVTINNIPFNINREEDVINFNGILETLSFNFDCNYLFIKIEVN
ncbi:hypothetical protein KPL39_02145 [Clostridium gasigenes]|uniref:hypothetical protein n=1 Tax=Clostridium gasigenes TaxID=94869 RepID=UPI001C0E54CA|nr:hypothetical protein [Clostridium gasigenes]MBU3135062.1 hypothetical protein [Clostridium gasigenes]